MPKSVLLFRFHNNPEVARERIKILQYFNPDVAIHALYGGKGSGASAAQSLLEPLVESWWVYPDSMPEEWKWQHTDLVLKHWFKTVGCDLEFDHLYSYEYDMLLAASLEDLYPKITKNQIALAAFEPFTKEIENRWVWTAQEPNRAQFLQFCEYLNVNYGIARQRFVCLGPGPLFSKNFLEEWSKTEDIDLVHDEIAYPAYAEALGYECLNNGLHPGFGKPPGEEYFSCRRSSRVTDEMLKLQLSLADGVRAFHPVKQMVTLEQVKGWLRV